MTAYYNEFDKDAAAWLRELIKQGHIAPGDVDERSIEDVKPGDLAGYRQVHFFAGIGGWSLALRLAGWPDDQPVWTGSCPCQPFSAAGQGAGFTDERHLWPAMQHLIAQCRPAAVFGEQVASKAANPWIDLVHADLENLGYAFGCVPFPAAGVGAPHIRDRNYWIAVGLADSDDEGLEGWGLSAERAAQRIVGSGGVAGRMANRHGRKFDGLAIVRGTDRHGQDAGRAQSRGELEPRRNHGGLANCADSGRRQERAHARGIACGDSAKGISARLVHGRDDLRPGPVNGQWGNADWIGCTDGKWRPVEPGTFPLAAGIPARVGRLRGYGNAIVPAQAAEFILASIEATQRELLRRLAA